MIPDLQVLYDALPENGDAIEYGAWRNAVPGTHWRYIQDMRHSGNVVFENSRDIDGKLIHTVRRAA